MSTFGRFNNFGPFFNAGLLVPGPKIYHYVVGTTTLKNAWTDRAKTVTAAQPLVGNSQGVASAFFDGLYKLVVKTNDDSATLFTWDNVDLTESVASQPSVWTPVLDCLNHGNLSVSYAYQQGQAVKVGDLVWLSGNLICTPTFTTATGEVQITGAPYDVTGNADPRGLCAIVNAAGAAAYKSHQCTMTTPKILKLQKVSHDVFTVMGITDFTSGVEIWIFFTLVYQGVE